MTEDQFKLMAASLIRHLLTLAAGWLVARGYLSTNAADAAQSYIAGLSIFAGTIGWSFIQKHDLLKRLCGALDISTVEQLLLQAANLRKSGADPLLISHMIGTALAVANAELAAARPDLVQQPNAAAGTDMPPAPPVVEAPAPPSPLSDAQEPGAPGVPQ